MTDRTLGSRYLLDEQIGAGGMGVVWRGRDRFTEVPYAIKLLRPEYASDPEAVARFVRERNTLVRFRHPSVVTLHDMIVEGDQLALVMDLVDGGDLNTYRQRAGGKLPPYQAAEMAAQICDGLAAAHTAGIVHRDLKPANVLLDHGQVKLADFGIARMSGDTSMTATGMVLGTAAYLAPELLADGDPSSASDVYAFGITLYELLSGQPPFGGNVANIMRGHLNGVPPQIPGIPDRLWNLVAACLAKQPAARPATTVLARALRDPALHRELFLAVAPTPQFASAPAPQSFQPGAPSFPPGAPSFPPAGQPFAPAAQSFPPAAVSFPPTEVSALAAAPLTPPTALSQSPGAPSFPPGGVAFAGAPAQYAPGAPLSPAAFSSPGPDTPPPFTPGPATPPAFTPSQPGAGPSMMAGAGRQIPPPPPGSFAPAGPAAPFPGPASAPGGVPGPRKPSLLDRVKTVPGAIASVAAVALVVVAILAAAQIGPFGSKRAVTGNGATLSPTGGTTAGASPGQGPTPTVSAASTASAGNRGTGRRRDPKTKPSASPHPSASKSQSVPRITTTKSAPPSSGETAYGPTLLEDGNFADGTLGAWNFGVENATVMPQGGPGNANAVRLTASPEAGVIQLVSGLTPGHRYLVTGWVQVSLGKIYVGAADNNANLTHQVAAGGSEPSGWHYVSVVYTAGTSTAQVYCVQKTGNGFCANMSFRAMR